MNTNEQKAQAIARLKRHARIFAADAVLLVGVAVIMCGINRISHTAAIIVAGVLVIALGFIIAPYKVAKK